MKHDEERPPKSRKSKDIAGQLDLMGSYAKEPDAACAVNAKPLVAPVKKTKPVKAKRRIVNLSFQRVTLDSGQVVSMPVVTKDQFEEIG